jgi:hypothetical protein
MYVRGQLVLSLLILLCVATVAAQSPSDKRTDSSSVAPTQTDQASIDSKNDSLVVRPLDSHTQHILTLGQNEATCYTLRTYRVTRDDPKSDTTRPAGYATCQRSTRFQLRTTVESVEIAPVR